MSFHEYPQAALYMTNGASLAQTAGSHLLMARNVSFSLHCGNLVALAEDEDAGVVGHSFDPTTTLGPAHKE